MERRSEHHPHRLALRGRGYFRRLGPGIVTGAADDDPSGIGTYSQVGATSGFQLLWAAPVMLPLAFAVQETCARLALVSGMGLARLIRTRLPRGILIVCIALVAIANTVNIAADLASMAAATRLLLPIPQFIGVVLFAVLIAAAEVFVPYHRYARILRWLCLSLLAYVAVLFVAHVDWTEVLHSTFVPTLTWSKVTFAALIALAGTTISPYLFFWQAAEEIEDEDDAHPDVSEEHVRAMRGDVFAGMLSGVFIMFAIMTTAGATLHVQGITDISTAEQAAQALVPIAGDFAGTLFLLGILGTGLLAIPVLAGSTAYAMSESFDWTESLERKPSQAKAFYGVIVASIVVGLLLGYTGVNPLHFLFIAALVNGLVAPFLLFVIWWLARDSEKLGRWRSPRWSQALVLFTALAMIVLPAMWLLAP